MKVVLTIHRPRQPALGWVIAEGSEEEMLSAIQEMNPSDSHWVGINSERIYVQTADVVTLSLMK